MCYYLRAYHTLRGSGYMTEAIKAFCECTMARKEVTNVIAETETNNPKSENVLKRVGFVSYEQNETKWWRYRQT